MKRKIFELAVAVYRVTDHFPLEEVLKHQLRRSANDCMAGIIEYGFFPKDCERMRTIQANIQTARSLLGVAKLNDFVKPINIDVLDREYSFFNAFFERELETLRTSEPAKTTFSARGGSAFGGENDMSLFNDMSLMGEKALSASGGSAFGGKEQPQYSTAGTTSGVSKEIAVSAPRETDSKDRKKSFVEKSITFSERISVNGNGNGHHSDTEKAVAPSTTNHARTNEQTCRSYNERQSSIIDYIRVNQNVKSTDLAAIFSNRFSIKTLQRDLAFLMEKNVIDREGDKRWAMYRLKEGVPA